MRNLAPLVCLLVSGAVFTASPPATAHAQEQPLQGQALVTAALANELRANQDLRHPMRYMLRKSSPRLVTSRLIYETKDGDVARLMTMSDKPLSVADDQKEQLRLEQLALDPSRQRHRKQSEDADRSRAVKVLRMLPTAFTYQDTGPAQDGSVTLEKFTFRPNPSFPAPDVETQVLTQMTGEILVDPVHERVVQLEGHLQQDVDFGWGILGRLYKGGWIRIDQAEVDLGQWRVVRFQMVMNGRVFWKPRNFDTIEEQSEFAPLPASMTYQEAIAMLKAEQRASR